MVKSTRVVRPVAEASAAKKRKTDTPVNPPESKHDRFDWRSLYLYAVCFITLLVCLFAVVSVIRSGVSLIYPDPGYVDLNSAATKASNELIRQNQLKQSQRSSILGMVNGLATLLVAGPLYFYHWRMVRSDSKR